MNIGIIDKGKRDKIDSRLSYSPSLEAAVNLILRDPALDPFLRPSPFHVDAKQFSV